MQHVVWSDHGHRRDLNTTYA